MHNRRASRLTPPCPRKRGKTRFDGLGEYAARALRAHVLDAEHTGRTGHGLARVTWLETLPGLDPAARPERVVAKDGYERWEGRGTVGYLVLEAIVRAQLADPPVHARVIAASDCFPTGMLGHYARRLAEGGLVCAITATSPAAPGPAGRRLCARQHEPAGHCHPLQ